MFKERVFPIVISLALLGANLIQRRGSSDSAIQPNQGLKVQNASPVSGASLYFENCQQLSGYRIQRLVVATPAAGVPLGVRRGGLVNASDSWEVSAMPQVGSNGCSSKAVAGGTQTVKADRVLVSSPSHRRGRRSSVPRHASRLLARRERERRS